MKVLVPHAATMKLLGGAAEETGLPEKPGPLFHRRPASVDLSKANQRSSGRISFHAPGDKF